MFCPKCAAQNVDGASYCRVCGANISLIPQALTGELPKADPNYVIGYGRRSRRLRRDEGSIEGAIGSMFMGLAFACIAMFLMYSRSGMTWAIWLLIPAFAMMGKGIARYFRYREVERRKYLPNQINPQPTIAAPSVNVISAPKTGELVPTPPSVTEGTTRHLGIEAPTRHFNE
jgi:hypothetical protein